MKRTICAGLVLALILFGTVAFAETNGQEQANEDIVRTSSQALTNIVQNRIATIAAPRPAGLDETAKNSLDRNGNFAFSLTDKDLGLSSGDEEGYTFGIWGLGSLMHFKSTADGAKYDADAYNVMLGYDYRATSDLLLGLAVGYGYLDLDKKDWSGGTDTGSLTTDYEWTVMPYLAYNITDYTILDGAFAYTDSRYKDDDGTNTGHYDSSRYLSNIGLSQYYLLDEWMFSGRVGYMYVHGDLSAYSRGGVAIANPDSYLGQLSGEAKASYFFLNGLEPYGSLRYFYDTSVSATPVDSDYDEFEGVLGANWYATDQFILNLETGMGMGRQKFESYRGQVNLRYEF